VQHAASSSQLLPQSVQKR